MDTTIVLQQMFILFFLMAIGFALRKGNLLDQKSNTVLSTLVLNVALPATIIMAVVSAAGARENLYLVYVLGVSALIYVILGALAVGSAYLMRVKAQEDRGALISISLFGNVAYMGFPLVIALWGPDQIFYAVLFNMTSNVIAFSVGIKLLAGAGTKISLKLIFNPLMNASLVAIVLFLLNIQIPPLLSAPLTHLRNMLTPMGMILVGSILGGMELKEVFSGWRVYVSIAVKLLAAPLAVFLILSRFITDPVMLGIFVLLSASPTAPRTAILCLRYGGNYKLVGQGIFLATVLSIATIPLLIHLLGF